MLPVQFILLLIVVSFPEAAGGGGEAPKPVLFFPWLALLSLVGMQLLVAAVAWMRTRKAIRELHEPGAPASAIMQQAETLYSRARWMTILLTAVQLYSTPLPQAVLQMLARWHIPQGPDGQFPILPELFFILPAVAAWVAIWTASYFLQSAGRERSMPYQLAQALPVHEMPTLQRYLSMQARHNFFPFVFLVLEVAMMWAAYGIVTLIPIHATPEQIANRATIAGEILGPAVAILAMPWLLIPLWSTTPLTGVLRERLDAIAAKHKLRFRNILIWRTEHMVVNAAILGWVPFARYFLMSDSLLEMISDRQIEAVFAHEVGHGVHRHVPWYIATVIGAFGLAFGLTGGSVWLLQAVFHFAPQQADKVAEFLYPIYWIGAMGLSVPMIAPRFENQADWFACRHMASMLKEGKQLPVDATESPAMGLETAVLMEAYRAGHYPHAAGVAAIPALTMTALPEDVGSGNRPAKVVPPAIASAAATFTPLQAGTEVFISALDAVVETSYRDRNRRGWMHPSVSTRLQLLRDMAAYPALAEQFARRMFRLRLIIAGIVLVGVGSGALALVLSGGK